MVDVRRSPEGGDGGWRHGVRAQCNWKGSDELVGAGKLELNFSRVNVWDDSEQVGFLLEAGIGLPRVSTEWLQFTVILSKI